MYDLNLYQAIGRLTREPEVKTIANGTKVANFSLAMTSGKNKQTGELKTEFVDCTAWESLAEIIEKYVTKGTQVYIQGQLQTRSWESQDGKKNYKTEILVKDMKILTPKGENVQTQKSVNVQTPKTEYTDPDDIDFSDIQTPF